MSDLSTLLSPEKRPVVVAELTTLVDDVSAAQSGITGMAIKGALSAARKVNTDIVAKGVDRLLPEILGDLQAHWNAFEQSGQADFGAFLEPRANEVAESFLSTADRAVEQSGISAIKKVYGSLRSRGTKIISPQVPALGRLIHDHMR